ncbi:MAG: hypothetical protein IRZ19_09195, partial [Pyrinomonas methylaliphatogenes]|nr:hypothetical protein [Pyrinomonas methylaliphatogenes]
MSKISSPIWTRHSRGFEARLVPFRHMIAEVYAKTDIGRTRKNNEDNFLVLDLHTGRALTASEGSFPPEMRRLEVG